LKAFLRIFLFLIVFSLPLVLRPILESRDFLLKADLAMVEGKKDVAMKAYADAVMWRSPLNYYAVQAEEKLKTEIGNLTDLQLKLSAEQELRSAKISSGHWIYGDENLNFKFTRPGPMGLVAGLLLLTWIAATLCFICKLGSSKYSFRQILYGSIASGLLFTSWLMAL